MVDEYFKKRSGCTDKGKDYEHIFILNIILSLILDDDVYDFKITSNDVSFGSFDDVDVEIFRSNGKQFLAFQLKHMGRPLTLKNLSGKSGPFSIKEYFIDYQKIKKSSFKYILLTNRTFNYKATEAHFQIEGDDHDVTILKTEDLNSLKFCTSNCFYKFESALGDMDEEVETSIRSLFDVYKEFFQVFYLCTDQLDIEKLKTTICDKFTKEFSCNKKVFRDLYDFIVNWSLKENKKIKLSKTLMKQVIAIYLLSPHIQIIKSNSFTTDNDVKYRIGLFLEVMSSFPITYFEKSDFETLQPILGQYVEEFRNNKAILKDVNVCGMNYQVISSWVKDLHDLNDEECALIMWVLNYGHLIVEENESIYKALNLCPDKKFIILRRFNYSFNRPSGFCSLADLDQNNKLQIISCNFQGKQEITLQNLLQCDRKIASLIKTSHLLQFINNKLLIGEEEELIQPYIKRCVSRLIISSDFLTSNTKSLIIVSGLSSIRDLESSTNIADIEELIINNYQTDRNNIFACKECPQKLFENICANSENYCHQLKFDNGHLEWIRSSGGVTELKKYLVEGFFTEETNLLQYENDNNINAICDEAGMGKTILLKNLKNNYSSEYWTILVYPKNHSKYFRENGPDLQKFMQYIFNVTSQNYNELEKELLNIFIEKKRVNFLWDALDETSDENFKIVLNIIKQLSRQGCKQWLTSRPNLKTTIENAFNVLARSLREFDESEQKKYIWEKLKNCSESDLNDIYQKITRNVQLLRYKQILGIPLQIYMFTELLLKKFEKYKNLFDQILSLAYLYQCFVDEKFNVLYVDKENFDGMNDMIYKRNQEYKEDRIKIYEIIAIRLHFPEVISEENTKELLDKFKSQADSVGIITYVSKDNIPNFWHNSYIDYFAASYLCKNVKLTQKLNNFFESRFDNIRFFFDLIMAEECPAHLCVLYKNLDAFRNCIDKEKSQKDKGGRNLLHLAAAWGEKYVDLLSEASNKFMLFHLKYRVYGVFASVQVKKDDSNYCIMFEELTQMFDSHEKDTLFGLNAISYADEARCLMPLSILSKQIKINFKNFKNFKDIPTVMYYAAFFELPDLLDAINYFPIVEDEFGESIVFTAVTNGSIKTLRKLMSSKYYKSVLADEKDKLLKAAFQNNHYEVAEYLFEENHFDIELLNTLLSNHVKSDTIFLKLLVKHRADVNTTDEDGHTPLYKSCLYEKLENAAFLVSAGATVGDILLCVKNPEILKLLIQNGANVNRANSDGKTLIMHASQNNFFETVKCLAENGALVDNGDEMGCRPIHYACIHGRYDVVEKLVEVGADVNVQNVFGFTPLHYACGQKHDEIVKLLLTKEARTDLRDADGRTIIEDAILKGKTSTLELLQIN